MATLTQAEIRKLYGVQKGDVVAFGARIKHTVPGAKRRKLQDLEFGSKAYNEEYNRMIKGSSKPVAKAIESEVTEIL